MGMSFFTDYEKTAPKPEEKPTPEEIKTMSTDDMKAYFDAMRESIINEVTEQIKQIKGGLNNASSSDLPGSEPDSAEPPVDGGSGS
jgi:hypothetical protein